MYIYTYTVYIYICIYMHPLYIYHHILRFVGYASRVSGAWRVVMNGSLMFALQTGLTKCRCLGVGDGFNQFQSHHTHFLLYC